MSANAPTSLTIRRVKDDDYAEKITVNPISGISAAELNVEGFGSITGVIDEPAKTIEFPVTPTIAGAAAGTYDFDVVVTAGGRTRTIVEGKWIISDRRVT